MFIATSQLFPVPQKDQVGGLDNPKVKTPPYVQGVLRKVTKNTKYEANLKQGITSSIGMK